MLSSFQTDRPLHSTMFPINQAALQTAAVMMATLHSTMFPINLIPLMLFTEYH